MNGASANNKAASAVLEDKMGETSANSKTATWIKRIFFYLVGLFLVALGISISIRSNLGVSALNSLPYVLSVILHINMGIIVAIVFSLYVVFQILILRRAFKPVQLLQFVVSLLFGYFVAFCNTLVAWITPTHYLMSIGLTASSVIIMGIGVTIYLSAEIVPLSAEGLVLVISQKLGKKFHTCKLGFDITLVLLSVAASLLGLKRLVGVREGTVIAAVFLGPIIGICMRLFGSRLRRFCLGAKTQM